MALGQRPVLDLATRCAVRTDLTDLHVIKARIVRDDGLVVMAGPRPQQCRVADLGLRVAPVRIELEHQLAQSLFRQVCPICRRSKRKRRPQIERSPVLGATVGGDAMNIEVDRRKGEKAAGGRCAEMEVRGASILLGLTACTTAALYQTAVRREPQEKVGPAMA